jgi:hypothetical protein
MLGYGGEADMDFTLIVCCAEKEARSGSGSDPSQSLRSVAQITVPGPPDATPAAAAVTMPSRQQARSR